MSSEKRPDYFAEHSKCFQLAEFVSVVLDVFLQLLWLFTLSGVVAQVLDVIGFVLKFIEAIIKCVVIEQFCNGCKPCGARENESVEADAYVVLSA